MLAVHFVAIWYYERQKTQKIMLLGQSEALMGPDQKCYGIPTRDKNGPEQRHRLNDTRYEQIPDFLM